MTSGSSDRPTKEGCHSGGVYFFRCTMILESNKGRKNKKLDFLWPKMARLGPRFGPPKSPEKVYVYVPLLRSFPGNEAHKLFLGAQNRVGAKTFMLKKFMCFFRPLSKSRSMIWPFYCTLRQSRCLQPPPCKLNNTAWQAASLQNGMPVWDSSLKLPLSKKPYKLQGPPTHRV